MTPIEQLVAVLRSAGWTIGDVLIPEQCAQVWSPATQTWIHITADPAK